ncbi:hypothetical protein nbrc107696_38390 [Gordonia spumicola]|uniref:DUF3558 domain-containing protein n=1 Tax=Gordonia spumicola TaxID=589161 RepID=A0A7I9VE49_9ACTN|nr:hypothetical protein [Gordonia spumicola]GEE03393.1 hypothetical protein nbrc107696_38390 [Gordonia spumicola]
MTIQSRAALVGVALAAGMATTICMGGHASAASGDPAVFPHTASLVSGKVTVSITNKAAAPANCGFTLYPSTAKTQVDDVVTAYQRGDRPLTDFSDAIAQLTAEQLGTADISGIAVNASKSGSTGAKGGSTSYYVLQQCATTQEASISDLSLAMDGYLVEGTAGTGGNGSLDTGSLGSLLP